MKIALLRIERWLLWRSIFVVRVAPLPRKWRSRYVLWAWGRVARISTRIAHATGRCCLCGRPDHYLDRNGDCNLCTDEGVE